MSIKHQQKSIPNINTMQSQSTKHKAHLLSLRRHHSYSHLLIHTLPAISIHDHIHIRIHIDCISMIRPETILVSSYHLGFVLHRPKEPGVELYQCCRYLAG